MSARSGRRWPPPSFVGVYPCLGEKRCLLGGRIVIVLHPEVLSYGDQIVLGQDLRAGHQFDVGRPEALGVWSAFDEFGCGPRQRVAGERFVAEDVAEAIAELIAHLGDAPVGGAAIGSGLAAVFDKGYRGVGRPGPNPGSSLVRRYRARP